LNDIWPYLQDGALGRLRQYFIGPLFYTGRRFERFAGGGENDEFTADDLVAVSMLGLTVQPEAALAYSKTGMPS
jgi:hypothetical protein